MLTPTYHVFAMNKGHQDARSLPVHVRSDRPWAGSGSDRISSFSASASVKDGAALVSLSNLDAARDLDVTLDLRGGEVGEPVARILTADSIGRHNTPQDRDAVAPRRYDAARVDAGTLRVRLPAHSFVTVELPVRT